MVVWWVPYWSWVHQQTWICIGEGMITGSQPGWFSQHCQTHCFAVNLKDSVLTDFVFP